MNSPKALPKSPACFSVLGAGCMALVAGCGEGGVQSDSATTRDTLPSGVVEVKFSPAAEPRWTIVEELWIGSVEGGGPDGFSELFGLAALDDGGFAVLDGQTQEIRVFDGDGAHVATHGGRGDGPGELQQAKGLMTAPDGLLWTPDSRNGRMSVFDVRDGFVESHPYRTSGYGFRWRGAMGADGRIFRPHLDWSSDIVTRGLVIYDQTMTALDTLPMGTYGSSDDHASSWCWSNPDGGGGCVGVPFYANEVLLIDPAGTIWQAEGGVPEYRIRKWTPGGDTAFVVVGDRSALPVTAVERESEIADLRERVGQDVDFDWSKIPDVKPVVEGLFLPGDGNLWVKVADDSGRSVFDVLSAADGSYQGTAVADFLVHVEAGSPLLRGDRIWLVATDDLELDYVVRGSLRDAR